MILNRVVLFKHGVSKTNVTVLTKRVKILKVPFADTQNCVDGRIRLMLEYYSDDMIKALSRNYTDKRIEFVSKNKELLSILTTIIKG